ncbi:MAG: dephospho-CoA kinase [Bacteroidota bacterium]|nr:dephospho-CoA kinase [Bacteroidota bacterium]
MKTIGLTGGIGSGKSTVARIFEVMGVPVYYSDDRAKEMYYVPEIKEKVIALLGKEAYLSDHQIDKKFIANKIFSNTDLLQQINNIIHPAVKKDFAEWATTKQGHIFVLKESALLFETGIYKTLDASILVVSPEQLRAKRIAKRDNLTEAEVITRFKSQMNDEQKIPLATYIIHNDEECSLIEQTLKIKEALQSA